MFTISEVEWRSWAERSVRWKGGEVLDRQADYAAVIRQL